MQMPSQLNQMQSFNDTRNWVNRLQEHEKMSDSQIPPSNNNRSQILNDARILVTRLQERDKITDSLIRYAQAVTEKINCLKEYKEDLNELQEMRIAQQPRSVLVANLQQENRQIKILQEENRQLKLALEEHQATLDMIMQRYRQQVVEMIKLNKLQQIADRAVGDVFKSSIADESNKMLEFASLFDHCLKVGEEASSKDQEELTRLKTENQTLRQLLKIAAQNDLTHLSSNVVEPKTCSVDVADSNINASETPPPASVSSKIETKKDDLPTTSFVNNPPVNDPTGAVRKKSTGRSETVVPQRAKSVEKSEAAAVNVSTIDLPSNQSSATVKANKIATTSAIVVSSATSTTTTTTTTTPTGGKPVPRTVPTAAAPKRSSQQSKVSANTATPSALIKKSTSQDSGLVNGGVNSSGAVRPPVDSTASTKPAVPAAKAAANAASSVKRKSSAGELKGAPPQTAGAGPTSKQSAAPSTAQQKPTSAKGTPAKGGQSR